MKISEIRAKYPEYADLPDEQLVIGMHRKFYSDMPFRDFNKNIEYDVLDKRDQNMPFSGPMTPQQEAVAKDMKDRPWGSGIAKAAEQFGGWVVDKTGSPEAGLVANVAAQLPTSLFGFRAGPMQSMTEAPARSLMQSAVKPSSTLPAKDVQSGLTTMLQEGISPTEAGMSKASRLAQKLNETTDAAIAASPETVNIKRVVSRLVDPYKRAMNQVNPQADMDAIEAVRKGFVSSPAVAGQADIPVALAQKLKSGTYTAVGEKAYGELGSASVNAQKQLARGLREEVIGKVPQIADTLKRESALRNVMEVAASRAAQDANKNPLSLGTSIAAIMHDPLAAAGMWANASTKAKAMAARILYQGGRPEVALPASNAAQRVPELFSRD